MKKITQTPNRTAHRRRVLGLVALGAVAVLVAGCGSPSADKGSTDGGNNIKTVAFAHPSSSSAGYPLMVHGAREEAESRGYELVASSANMDATSQLDELNTWIAQRISGIIVAPVDTAAMGPVLKRAQKNDVKLLAYAAKSIPGADGSVIFDNLQGAEIIGAAAGDWVNEVLGGKAKVALLTDYDQETGAQRIDGAVAALKEKAPGVEIVASQEGLFSDETLPIVQSMLQAHPDINVVFCMTSDGCVGAQKAFMQTNPSAERQKQMFMAGWDGAVPVLKEVAGGSVIRAIAVLNLVEVGRASIEATINAIEGKGETDLVIPYQLVDQSDIEEVQKIIDTYEEILAG